jgi:hypothetical protein
MEALQKMSAFVVRLLVPPYEPKEPPSKTVAIVVPISTRAHLTSDEEISMRHLRHFFGRYEKYIIAPRGLPVQFDGFQIKRFPRKFFGSLVAHNRLTYSLSFYKAFKDYRFIFFYHLDSLAFSDQLAQWCNTDLDYIGAPWLQCADMPWVKKPRVGNGGFTLLRTEAALKVLHNRYRTEPIKYWLELVERNAGLFQPLITALRHVRNMIPRHRILESLSFEWERIEEPVRFGRNNDLFWADEAVKYLPSFKVASVETGLRFAFETPPRVCYEMNNRQLPFGCHAWAKFDRSFWEPYLLQPEESKKRDGPLNASSKV